MKGKREPTLLDAWFAAGGKGPHTRNGPPLSRFLEAHKFVFDDKASSFVGDLLRRAPMEVLQEHEFARTPYDVTWVEIDHPSYMTGLGHALVGDYDTKVGFLFDHNRVYQFAQSKGRNGHIPVMIPYVTYLHQPSSFEHELEQAQLCGMSRLTYRQALLGTINVIDRELYWNDQATDITRAHRVVCDKRMIDLDNYTKSETEVWRTFMITSAGSLKLVIALALLLSRPGNKVLNLNDVAQSKGIWKGRNMVYKAHNRVTIRLARRDPVVRFTTALATGLHRRRHGVRGHWAQTRKLAHRNCDHSWDIVSINRDKYQCGRCGAKRWWRTAHMRGDATRGFVTKEYDVTE
jgi:hypothetical protein